MHRILAWMCEERKKKKKRYLCFCPLLESYYINCAAFNDRKCGLPSCGRGADTDTKGECLETCCGLPTMPGSWVRMD